MKSKIKKRKRATFLKTFLLFLLPAIVISFAFAFGFREYIRKSLHNEANDSLERTISATMFKIGQINAEDENKISSINAYLAPYTNFSVYFNNYTQISSSVTENCYAVSAIFDSDNNIVASNKQKLEAIINSGENEKSEWYVCDKELFNIPQLDEMFEYYNNYRDTHDLNRDCRVILDSVYVNKSELSFIPHECTVEISQIVDGDNSALNVYENVESKNFTIELDDENYELITLNRNSSGVAPYAFVMGIYGTEKDVFDDITASISPNKEWISAYRYKNNDLFMIENNNKVYIDGEEYCLYTAYVIDENADVIMRFYWKYVAVVSIILLVAVLLLSWRKNVINKAQYAFEDYQKTLINNLAHDTKTPLTAIGGYTENAVKSLESGDKRQIMEFLDAISENVFYIDNLVNRTLELNHLNEIREVKKELVQVHKIADSAVEKYSLILSRKNITVKSDGEFELTANRETIESAIENLISNAVKYTVENGEILIKSDKNSITITNTVAGKIDTENLAMPFVKGDKSRNEKSSGIGLAIVKSAADLNRLKLAISPDNNKFRVVLSK